MAASLAGDGRFTFGRIGDCGEPLPQLSTPLGAGLTVVAQGSELLFDLVDDVAAVESRQLPVAGDADRVPARVVPEPPTPTVRDPPQNPLQALCMHAGVRRKTQGVSVVVGRKQAPECTGHVVGCRRARA